MRQMRTHVNTTQRRNKSNQSTGPKKITLEKILGESPIK